jgi:hypothetical protein
MAPAWEQHRHADPIPAVAFFNSAVGRSPPLGYRRLDDAPPAREGPREIKRSGSPPRPAGPRGSNRSLVFKKIVDSSGVLLAAVCAGGVHHGRRVVISASPETPHTHCWVAVTAHTLAAIGAHRQQVSSQVHESAHGQSASVRPAVPRASRCQHRAHYSTNSPAALLQRVR